MRDKHGMGPDENDIEDILASIRRVMDEDAPAAPATPADEDDAEDELELTQPIEDALPPPPAAGARARPLVSPYAGLRFRDRARQEPAAAPMPAGPLVSPDAADASRQALTYLSSLRLKEGEPGEDTLNGLVREMLKPMLKAWLDAELPGMVERLVVQEIARLTAGRE